MGVQVQLAVQPRLGFYPPSEQLTSYFYNAFTFIISSPMPTEFPFVKEPPQDFYCPVTCDLLLQPHLTSCCRQNLSQGAVARLQREKKTCPLCRESEWRTEFNEELQRKVGVLRVFCPNVDRGCQWQGYLHGFDGHVQTCSTRDAPLSKPRKTNGYDCLLG